MWSCGRWEKLNKLKTTARVQSCRPSHSWCFCLVSLKTFGPFHIWHAECVKVQTQRSIHGRTQFTSESVSSRRTEWVSSSCERARLKLLLGDLWVTTCWFPEERLGLTGKHTHTHTQARPPTCEPPRTTSSSITSRGRRLSVRTTHHQLHTEASDLLLSPPQLAAAGGRTQYEIKKGGGY